MERKAAQRYFSQVRRGLVCGWEDRHRLLARCTVMVDDFQQENPGAGYDGIVAAFGEPASFAAELLSSLESAKVEAAQKRRRLIRLGALMFIASMLVVVSVFWYIKYQQSVAIDKYYYAVVYPPEEMSTEEYEAATKDIPEESHWRLEE